MGLASVSTASAPYQFAPETYGAKGDNATDDMAAINSAVSAAVTYALANNYYAEIVFSAKTYLVAGATTRTTTNKGNSQIPLPVQAVAGKKLTLVFKGVADTPIPYFSNVQTVAQVSGAVLRSTSTAANDGSWGEPSVIGGPTPIQGYGGGSSLFSNILVFVDGISLVLPNNPTISGFDFRGCATAHVRTASILSNVDAKSITEPTNTWQFGLAMPHVNNNVYSYVESFTCYGCYFAFMPSEHTMATFIRCIYDEVGIAYTGGGGSSTPHAARILHATIEGCVTGLMAVSTASPSKIDVDFIDWEANTAGGPTGFGVFHIIHDPSNFLVGTVGLRDVTPDVNGGSQLRVINLDQARGRISSPPAIPASTVVLQNPYWRDAAVTVTGGVVTAVTVDGGATGATAGTVILPTGKNIALTYSVVPTSWNWVLL